MSDDHENPYAAPQVEFSPQSDSSQGSAGLLHELKPRSVILMIFLTIFTAGLYMNFWVHRLATAINQELGQRRISMGLVSLFWAVSLASILWVVPEILTEDDSKVVGIGNLLTNADMIFALLMAFTIRGGLNSLIQVPRTHHAWFHGLWTALLGIYYLQWKINKNLRSRELPQRRASPAPEPSFDFLPDAASD